MKSWFLICLGFLILAGCITTPVVEGTPITQSTGTLPLPVRNITQTPDVGKALENYLDSFIAGDYEEMYAKIASLSRDAINLEDFTTIHESFLKEAAIVKIDYEILSVLTHTKNAQIAYRMIYTSAIVGEIQRDTQVGLVLENGEWRIQWDEKLLLPELSGGNYLRMDYKIPARANIYDLNGKAMVAQSDAVALGIIPGQINPETEEALLDELWRLTGIRPEVIKAKYENQPSDWYIPLVEVSAEKLQPRVEILSSYDGIVMTGFNSRFYFNGGLAPHVIGYMLRISEENLDDYRSKGYLGDELVGAAGLEKWGELYLAGTHGGTLYVHNPSGYIVYKLGQKDPVPAQSIYTTIDSNLQSQAQEAIKDFNGAIVVMELNTGRVLALVSSPAFDPNLFEPTNRNSVLLNSILNDPNQPLFNRATQGLYPPGSIFKPITMTAALETGSYTVDTRYYCGHYFEELPGWKLADWTVEKDLPPSGTLTLMQGLMRSCNPYFWHIGLDLYMQGFTTAVTSAARSFGLGSATGIGQVAEAVGQVIEPQNDGDAVQQAIGQGNMQVTPLQIVSFYAAIGNGGTLYRPQIIERIISPDGTPVFEFKPETISQIDAKPETIAALQQGLLEVIRNQLGTAYRKFLNFAIKVAGKTGTAQDEPRDPHAWFAGYTLQNQEGKPDIAVVVIAENAGEGSTYAAPIFKRVVEIYFYGKPLSPYSWESQIGVKRTPEPEATPTP